MGRGGITFSEVEQAALYLQDKGRTPTVDGVREYLGTGSRTTLAMHLRKWKETQQDSTGQIPKQLTSIVASLWDQLQEQANNRALVQQTAFDAETAELRKELLAAKEHSMRQETHLVETQRQRDESREEAIHLKKKLEETSKSCEHLEILHKTIMEQLNEARAENQRLHELSRQIQKNLEHYQQAVYQQKTEDNLRQEKQHATFRQEIVILERTLVDTRKQLASSEKEAATNAREMAISQTQYTRLSERHDLLLKECREKENECLQIRTRYDLLSKQDEKLKQELTEMRVVLQTAKQQEAVLDSQAKKTEIALRKAEDKISMLQDEMLFIKQEAAEKSKPLSVYKKNEFLKEQAT